MEPIQTRESPSFRLAILVLVTLFLAGSLTSSARAQESYQTQQSLRPKPAITPGKAGPESNPAPRKPSQRFLGWKDAEKQGPDAVRHFVSLERRPKPIPRVSPAYVPAARAGSQLATRSTSGLHPFSLPGIELRPSLPAGLIPTAVAVGDFNGDGKLDWVVTNGGDNTLYLYLGNGDGTSQLPVIIPLAGKSPVAVAAADLNGDGKLDLVVAEADTKTVGILFGNGDGTFQSEVELPAFPVATLAVAVADLNKDGHPDLVVGVAGDFQTVATGRFAALLNDGAGHFGAPIYAPNVPSYQFPSGSALSVADVNKDGFPDVLVTGNDDNGGSTQIFLGNGDGTFAAGEVVEVSEVGLVPRIVTNAVLANVNGDGCPDAIVADTFTEAVIFPGDCKGNFDNSNNGAIVYGMGDVANGLAVADINGDGHPDIIIGGAVTPQQITPLAGYATGDTIGVRLNDGTGHFGPLKVYRGDPGIYSLVVADLAGNGRPEVITANQEADTTTVYINDGSGGFGQPSGGYDGEYEGTVNGFFNSPSSPFYVTDVNGDGLPDLALMEFPDSMTTLYQITVMLNQGNGQFAPPVRTPALQSTGDYQIGDFLFADFRNTGQKDFLGVAYDDSLNCGAPQLVYAPNMGNGSFGAPVQIPFPVTTSCFAFPVLGVGDFNKDGKLDFAIASSTGPSNSPFQLTVYLGNGDGTFRQASQVNFGQSNPPTYPQGMFIADANLDGKPDIFVRDDRNVFGPGSTGKDLLEFLGNGDGTFQAPRDVLQNLDFMTMTDLNHDGLLDVIAITTTGDIGFTPAVVNIYLGKPDGTFGPPTTYSPFSGPFDIFYGNNVTLEADSALGPYVGDFSGNGNVDIAIFQEQITGPPAFVQFLAGNGDGTFTPAFNIYSLGIGHDPDLVVANAFGDGRTAFLQTPNYPASFHFLPDISAPAFQVEMVETPVVTGTDGFLISLNVPSTSDTTVSLSASNPGVQIPASATIPANTLSTEVTFTLANNFPVNQWFSITAQGNGTTASAYDFSPPPNSPDPFSLMVLGGFPVMAPGQSTPWTATVTATGNAFSTFQASCSGLPATASCTDFLPPSFFVPPGGGGSGAFTITTEPSTVPGAYPFTVTVTDGFVTLSAPETLNVGDFTISVSPPSVTAQSTSTASFELTIGSLFGYVQPVTATCSGLPAGASCVLEGDYVSGTGPFQVNLNNVAPGTYNFLVTGVSGPLTHSAPAQLVVVPTPTFTGSLSPTSATISVGGMAMFNLSVSSQNSFSGAVSLTCPNLPGGITCQFSPSQITVIPNVPGTSVLTVAVTAKPAGTFPSRRLFPPASVRFSKLFGAMAVLCLTSLLITFMRRERAMKGHWTKLSCAAVVLLALILVAGLSSCGGSGGGGGGGGGGNGPVTVKVHVQGTSGSTVVNLGTLPITVP